MACIDITVFLLFEEFFMLPKIRIVKRLKFFAYSVRGYKMDSRTISVLPRLENKDTKNVPRV
jgi:hypothetical protein